MAKFNKTETKLVKKMTTDRIDNRYEYASKVAAAHEYENLCGAVEEIGILNGIFAKCKDDEEAQG